MALANTPNGAGQASQLQLQDIHLPEQVSNFPIAPGWWILLTLIILTVLWSYRKHQKNNRLNASKKQALAILANNESLSAKECIELLKWVAMQYFSRQHIAKLYGQRFHDFLIKQLPEKQQQGFVELSLAAFNSQYQTEQQVNSDISRDCQQATKLWLDHALPVKKPLSFQPPFTKDKELS